MELRITAAVPADQPRILALVRECGLPLDGLNDHLHTALVARDGDTIVGCVALECYDHRALLRSLAVDTRLRGQGLGQQLMEAGLELACRHGIDTVYLLTETAVDFFPRFGFQRIERTAVPSAVQQSAEFSGACPASAQAMVCSLSATTREWV